MYNYNFKFIVFLNAIIGYLKLVFGTLVTTWSSTVVIGYVTG